MRTFPTAIAILIYGGIAFGTLASKGSSAIAEETNEVVVETNMNAVTNQSDSPVREAFDQERAENWEWEHESDGTIVAHKVTKRLSISRLVFAVAVLGVTGGLASFARKRQMLSFIQ
jgi:hypothetical protein